MSIAHLPPLLASVVLAGCATTTLNAASLSPSPDEVAFLHDGAPAPAQLLLTYRVTYESGAIVRPGGRHDGDAARAPAWSPEAAAYLAASDAATGALATPAVTADRLVNDVRLVVAVPAAIAAAGAAGAAAGAPTVERGFWQALIGGSAGAFAGFVAISALQAATSSAASFDYARAVRLFNHDLAQASVHVGRRPSGENARGPVDDDDDATTTVAAR